MGPERGRDGAVFSVRQISVEMSLAHDHLRRLPSSNQSPSSSSSISSSSSLSSSRRLNGGATGARGYQIERPREIPQLDGGEDESIHSSSSDSLNVKLQTSKRLRRDSAKQNP